MTIQSKPHTFGGQCNHGHRDEQKCGCQSHSPIKNRNKGNTIALEIYYT